MDGMEESYQNRDIRVALTHLRAEPSPTAPAAVLELAHDLLDVPHVVRHAQAACREGAEVAAAGIRNLPGPRQTTPNSFPTATKASTASSRSASVWIAEIWQRSRACPCGTTGKPKPET